MPNAAIYVSKAIFRRRTFVDDGGIYAEPRLTIPSISRRRFTCLASRIQRDRCYRGTLCKSIARRNLINLHRWNSVSNNNISLCCSRLRRLYLYDFTDE